MIWDKSFQKDNKFRPYLDFIADQESALKVARQNILIVKHGLNKKPMEVAQNAINILSTSLEDRVRRFDTQDRVVILSWATKVIWKIHNVG